MSEFSEVNRELCDGQRRRSAGKLRPGGMATVYLADDLRHGRQVAVKVLRPELGTILGPDRFTREIRIAGALNHPHVLLLHDSGEAGGLLFYVMPYVRGGSLRQRLSAERRLPVHEAVEIVRNVASALDHAHAHSLIHRDIKPENILLHEGEAMVTDFGIALGAGSARAVDPKWIYEPKFDGFRGVVYLFAA
jgi:serine/threonine protein kinase